MYQLAITKQFEKDYELYKKRGHKMELALTILLNDTTIFHLTECYCRCLGKH